MGVPEKELKAKIKEILDGADLERITSKLVRRQLEDHFHKSLTDQRKEIDEIIMRTLNNEKSAESGVSSADDKDDVESGSSSDSSLDRSTPPPSQPKQKAKSHSSPSTSGRPKKIKNVQLSDEELARQLQLSENGMRVRRRVNMSLLPWYAQGAKKRSASRNGKSEGEGQPAKKSRARVCLLDAKLADLVGGDQMSRSDVVKRLWAIAKERNLFDPQDRRFVICDEQFKTVFKVKRMKMFLVTKHLNNLVKDTHAI